MADPGKHRYYRNMDSQLIPVFDLYGERSGFPDLLHCETIDDRAALHDWTIDVHRHAGLHQFLLLSAGAAEVTADGSRVRPALPALISVPRRVAHGFRFARGTEGYVVTLPVDAFPAIFAEGSGIVARLGHWACIAAPPDLAALFGTLAAEHRGTGLGRTEALRGLALLLSARVARLTDSAAPAPARPYARLMAAFDALVALHMRQRWRVADYAAALGVTPTHLNRVTRSETGTSTARYIEKQAFQEACRLLAYTRISVSEIAWSLGFEDPSYFSRAFRRQTGLAPLDYRGGF